MEIYLKGNLHKDTPILSSIHMMKGGEADNVFIIDYPRFPYTAGNLPIDQVQQEINLQYVALTRPKKSLYLCLIERLRRSETIDQIEKANRMCKLDIQNILKTKN